MNKLETGLETLGSQIPNAENLKKLGKLYDELEKIGESAEKNEWTEKAKKQEILNVVNSARWCANFLKKLKEKNISLSIEELEIGEVIVGKISPLLNGEDEEVISLSGGDIKLFLELDGEIRKFEEFIQVKKISLQNPSENHRILVLEKLITKLQSRIAALENKKTQTPDNSADFQRYDQQVQQLKSELKEKEKEKEKEKNQQPSKKNDFPTGLVVGGGIVAVVLLLVVILLLSKKSKK